MDATELFKQLNEVNPDTLTDKALFDLTVTIEEAMQRLHAQAMTHRAAAAKRHAHRSHNYRSNPTGLAARTRLSRATCAANTNQAETLVHHLTEIHDYYLNGLMNRSQIDLICRLHSDRALRKFVVRDQNFFIDIASDSWPDFKQKAEAWAQATRGREEDNDPAAKAFQNRKLIWGQGLDQETLGEIHIPNEMFEQFLEIVTPFYDALRREEIRDARLAAGVDPNAAPAEGDFFDLARTDSQRWLDALMAALRVRGGHLKQLRHQAIAAGADPDASLELDLDDVDAGVAAQVIIVADHETLERELARQLGVPLVPRTNESMVNYRCETLSGLPIAPSTALAYAELGSFRRMIFKPDSLDFEMSRKARLFCGPKKLGLVVRDRHCQGPGCDTQGSRCQADHIDEYSRGGPTIPTNGELLCGPCNRHKEWLRSHAVH